MSAVHAAPIETPGTRRRVPSDWCRGSSQRPNERDDVVETETLDPKAVGRHDGE